MVFARLAACLLATLVGLPALAAASMPPLASLDPAVIAEATRLRQALEREVAHPVPHDAMRDKGWIELARAEIAGSDLVIDHPQLLTVVDRNPRVQQLMVLLAVPTGSWQVIGGSSVSTGQTGRFDHYITPRGVFRVTDAILGFRAEGTPNENGIRGLGAKGMRVWDFGWQVAMKGWSEPPGKPDRTPIRLMLHATDPDRLEQRIGRPASQGCVRVPATMNRFLDQHGVLDAEYERAATTELRFRALLRPGREPTTLAGSALVVVDSTVAPALMAQGR